MKPLLTIVAFAGLSLSGCNDVTEKGAIDRDSSGSMITRSEPETGSRSTAFETEVDEVNDGVRVRVTASGIAAGPHGMHVHEIGRCDGPAFTSAGAHWNPTSNKHGRDNPAGPHLGDLENLVIGPDGRGSAEVVIAGAKLTEGSQPLFDEDGAALLIHAAADDYRTDPGGDSGDRILCAVLQAPK